MRRDGFACDCVAHHLFSPDSSGDVQQAAGFKAQFHRRSLATVRIDPAGSSKRVAKRGSFCDCWMDPEKSHYNERARVPLGFRLIVGASDRLWDTRDGKAHIPVHPGLASVGGNADAPLVLTTIRSHDQYNMTIYGYNDHYRGITGRRDVILANAEDMAVLGISHGDTVDVVGNHGRVPAWQTIVAHPIARGSVAAYYPEANRLIDLETCDPVSGTPAYKSIPVSLRLTGSDRRDAS